MNKYFLNKYLHYLSEHNAKFQSITFHHNYQIVLPLNKISEIYMLN